MDLNTYGFSRNDTIPKWINDSFLKESEKEVNEQASVMNEEQEHILELGKQLKEKFPPESFIDLDVTANKLTRWLYSKCKKYEDDIKETFKEVMTAAGLINEIQSKVIETYKQLKEDKALPMTPEDSYTEEPLEKEEGEPKAPEKVEEDLEDPYVTKEANPKKQLKHIREDMRDLKDELKELQDELGKERDVSKKIDYRKRITEIKEKMRELKDKREKLKEEESNSEEKGTSLPKDASYEYLRKQIQDTEYDIEHTEDIEKKEQLKNYLERLKSKYISRSSSLAEEPYAVKDRVKLNVDFSNLGKDTQGTIEEVGPDYIVITTDDGRSFKFSQPDLEYLDKVMSSEYLESLKNKEIGNQITTEEGHPAIILDLAYDLNGNVIGMKVWDLAEKKTEDIVLPYAPTTQAPVEQEEFEEEVVEELSPEEEAEPSPLPESEEAIEEEEFEEAFEEE